MHLLISASLVLVGWCDPGLLDLPNAASLALTTLDPAFVLRTASFSVCMWVQPRDVSASKQGFISLGPNTGANDGLFFGFWNLQLYAEFDSTGSYAVNTPTAFLLSDINVWHHYCLVYSSATPTLLIYRDGKEVARNVIADDYHGASGPLILGGSGSFVLDEVRLHRYAFTSAEITSIFSDSSYPSASAMLYLPFSEKSSVVDHGPLLGNSPFVLLGGSQLTGCCESLSLLPSTALSSSFFCRYLCNDWLQSPHRLH
jgi:hypothetical protein